MTAALEDVVDPRIAVLIVWAIFFFVFIILPSLCIRCIGCCSNRYAAEGHRDREGVEDDAGFGSGWDSYVLSSVAKRQRIDELRSAAIRRYLAKFSLLLEERHMVTLDENGEEVVDVEMAETKSISDEEGSGQDHGPEDLEEGERPPDGYVMASPDDYDHTSQEYCIDFDEKITLDPPLPVQEEETDGVDKIEDANDEEGMIDIMAPPGPLGVELKGETLGPCLVTRIKENGPLSGKIQVGDKIVSVDDRDVQLLPACAISVILLARMNNTQRKITIFRRTIEDTENEEDEPSDNDYTHVSIPFPGYDSDGIKVEEKPVPPLESTTSASWRLPFFQNKVQVADETQQQDIAANEKTTEDAAIDNKVDAKRNDERRAVPHFCAICLGEYGVSETISWSSNEDCTHIFHQECIVQWLNTLGRKMSKYTRFSDEPDVLQLLAYRLECPCCRGDFISKLVLVNDEYCGDDNV